MGQESIIGIAAGAARRRAITSEALGVLGASGVIELGSTSVSKEAFA